MDQYVYTTYISRITLVLLVSSNISERTRNYRTISRALSTDEAIIPVRLALRNLPCSAGDFIHRPRMTDGRHLVSLSY